MTQINDHLVLVCGKSTMGKTTCLRTLRNPEGVMYLNCENGKRPPYREANKFKMYTITDPFQVHEAFTYAETQSDIHTIVIDSLTFLLTMAEKQIVHTAKNPQKAWGRFQNYITDLMLDYVAKSTKKIIFTAHVVDQINEAEMVKETFVPVKGALKAQGIESFFNVIISVKKIKINDLEGINTPFLNITDHERELGYKHCIQTRLTKDTVTERLREPLDMWTESETFIDSDIQIVLDRLDEYYG